jgi:signal transduction histidine kinase
MSKEDAMDQLRQEVRYTLARRGKQRPALHVRSRRRRLIWLVVLLYIPAVLLSVSDLIKGEHWWGIGVQQVGGQAGKWQITWIDGSEPLSNYNVRPGDIILSADGQAPQSEQQINRAMTLTLAGRSQPITWQVPSQLDDLLSLSWIVLGAISLLLGLLIYLHATERALAPRFFFLWTTLAFASALEPATSFGDMLATHIADALAAGAFFGLLASFLWLLLVPARPGTPALSSGGGQRSAVDAKQARHRWAPEILIITGIMFETLHVVAATLKQQQLADATYLPIFFQTTICICLSLFFILRASFSRRNVLVRERGRTLLGGLSVGLLPLLLFTVIPLLISGQALVSGQVSALAAIALPLSFGYAIVRRDLLRVDSLIRNTTLILLTALGMVIVAILLAEVLNLLPSVPALVLGIIAGAILAPLVLNAARWLTETWLFPQVRRYRKLIASGGSIERTGLDPQRLAGQLVGEVHLALPVRQVIVFVPDKQSGQLLALPAPPTNNKAAAQPAPRWPISSPPPSETLHYAPLLLDEAVAARLNRGGTPILVEPAPRVETPSSPDSSQPGESVPADLESWHLLIPMRVRGRLVGILALSRREDEQSYSHTDLQLLRFLAGRRALALDYSLLYADLHAAYEQRRELDAAKDRFIVTAHHELRTPLTGVQGYLELLRGLGAAGRATRPKEVELFIERACQSADELSEQLDSLLKAAEAGFSQSQLKLQPVSASAVAQRAIQALDAQARRSNHRVHNQIPPDLIVFADEEALYRMFMNLLSNALKYSPGGRMVLLDGRIVHLSTQQAASAGQEPTAMLIIRDWGQGVHPRDKYKIFERFTRLDHDLNSPVRGSGLGLAICKELVTAMGGTIDVESDGVPGSGSTFWFTLPLASPLSGERNGVLHLSQSEER